jgi:hypothetical protein
VTQKKINMESTISATTVTNPDELKTKVNNTGIKNI